MDQGFRRIGDVLPADYRERIEREYQRRQAERNERIRQHGWDSACECDECGDTGHNVVTNRTCWCPTGEAQSDAARRLGIWNLMMPTKFADARLSTHPNRDVADKVRFWLHDGYPEGRNLMLTGGVGTGKTFMAAAVLYEVHMLGRRVMFDTMPSFLRRLRPVDGGQPDLSIGQMCNADLLVIDDLGTEKMTEWAAEQLITIIDTRGSNEKSTIITTNLPLAIRIDPGNPRRRELEQVRTIEKLLDERSFSRLIQNIQVTPVTGEDLRRTGRAA